MEGAGIFCLAFPISTLRRAWRPDYRNARHPCGWKFSFLGLPDAEPHVGEEVREGGSLRGEACRAGVQSPTLPQWAIQWVLTLTHP